MSLAVVKAARNLLAAIDHDDVGDYERRFSSAVDNLRAAIRHFDRQVQRQQNELAAKARSEGRPGR